MAIEKKGVSKSYKVLEVDTNGQGFYEMTDSIQKIVNESNCISGFCIIFLKHTSASIVIHERGDPNSWKDSENFMTALVKNNSIPFEHFPEIIDDAPSHIRSVLAGVSLVLLVEDSDLILGEWQGMFLWEHRSEKRTRSIVVRVFRLQD